MSTLGKIFAFIVFVCAVAFAAAAYVLVQETVNWHEKYEQTKKELGDEVKSLTEKNERLEDEKQKTAASAETWRTTLDDQMRIKGELDAEIIQLNNRIKDLENSKKRLEDTLAKNTNELKLLRETNVRLNREKETARAARIKAEDDRRKAEDLLAGCKEELKDVRNMLKEAQVGLRSAIDLNKRYGDLVGTEGKRLVAAAKTALPKIDGRVRRADNKSGIILISVGKDDGVAKGMAFEVIRTRANRYIGRIHVTEVAHEQAFCRIDLPMTTTAIREGDDVTTRLK